MAIYGGLATPIAALINAAFVAYLALYPALFGLTIARLTRIGGARLLLVAPAVWVATEYGRSYLLTGFPWVLLGNSQVTVLPVAQMASLTGVFGLSWLVAGINAAVALGVIERAARTRHWYTPLAVTLAVVVGVSIWGSLRIARGDLMREGQRVRVGLIQGNVDQSERVELRSSRAVYSRYLQMTRQAIAEGAQFVIWPESSTPFYFEDDHAAAEEVRTLTRQAAVPLLLGSDQIERGRTPKYYNAAFMVAADGSTAGAYQKMHLVPFGEYVPARRLFFFMERIVEAVSDFSPGVSPMLLPVGAHKVSASICYEIVYPDLVRRFTQEGSELLTTITNDAWFGTTSAPHQHFEQAAMRAIENGRFLVRAANTGLSGIVDPYGRVLDQSGLFETAVVVGDARFLRTQTLYTRVGDVWAYASIVGTAVLLAAVRRRVQ